MGLHPTCHAITWGLWLRRLCCRYVVSPTLSTLGLYVHTHRKLFVRQWRSVALATLLGAPVGLVATALVGSKLLQLPTDETATMIAGTTTTGLALTMPAAFPLMKAEWIALPTVICGCTGMVLWPTMLRVAGLTAAPTMVNSRRTTRCNTLQHDRLVTRRVTLAHVT